MSKREPINENAGPVAFFLDPTPGRIIVVEDQFQAQGRIIVPDTLKRRPTTGKILAVGDGVYDMLKVGERVVYGLYSGTVINFKGQPAFRILGQDEVLSIVRGADLILEGVGT
jgi:chaperonin GroES